MPNRRFTGRICAVLTIGYLIVGLWPFDFLPRNHAEWLSSPRGIRFKTQSVLYSNGTLELAPNPDTGQVPAITLELSLMADSEPDRAVLPILAIYDDRVPENILILQWKSGLLWRTPGVNRARHLPYREIDFAGILHKGRRRFISITSGAAGTDLYVDGMPERRYPTVILAPKPIHGRLIVGTWARGRPNWTGELYGLDIFGRKLDAPEILHHYQLWKNHHQREIASEASALAAYVFDQGAGSTIPDDSPSGLDLVIPAVYPIFHRTVLLPPWDESLLDSSHIEDVAINVLGFVPFGFVFLLYSAKAWPGSIFRNVALSVLAAGMLSTCIELSQVFLPTRYSSLTDLICNTAGGLIGASASAALPLLSPRANYRPSARHFNNIRTL